MWASHLGAVLAVGRSSARMAIGFIIPIVLILITFGLLLWRAVVRGGRWLVWTIFVIVVIPGLLQMSEIIYVTFFRPRG